MESAQAPFNGPQLSRQEQEDLLLAKSILERVDLATQLANVVGMPIQKAFQMMPPSWSTALHRAVRLALWSALNVAVTTLDRPELQWSRKFLSYKVLLGATGGLGGAFGLAALPFELPISTTLMLRGIAEIARDEGFALNRLETRMACLEVLAFGGPMPPKDTPVESSYWMVRSALGQAMNEATAYLARCALVEGSAPVLVRFVETVATRFGVTVSHQAAARAVPLLGGIAGSAINILFMDHFQKVALGHFIVKRLEAKHSAEVIRGLYEQLVVPAGLRAKV